MADFSTVLNDACQLSEAERMQLIAALWETIPEDADHPLHGDWGSELERRVAAINSGIAQLVPWETIRTEALARIQNGKRT